MIFRCNNRGIRAVSALMCGAMLWGSVPAAMAADSEEIAIEIEDTDTESSWSLLDAMAYAVQPELAYTAVTNGYYRFVNAASGEVWTTKGRGGEDGAEIACRTNEEMTTQVYQLQQAQDGTFRLLSCTVKGLALRVSGSGLVQAAQTGEDSERFCAVQEENGTLSIRSVSNPDLALTQNGSSVTLEQYSSGSGQQWTLERMSSIHQETIPSGIYTIDSVRYNKSIKASGSSLTMDDKTISGSQKFQIKYVGDGKYVIRAYSGTGKRVTTSSSAGSAVKLSGSECRYYIDRKADGTYAIIRAGTRDTAVKAGSTRVTTTRYDGGKSQSWTFDSNVVEDETAVSKTLSKIQTRYPSGAWLGGGYSFAGGYQCMGFGREVFCRTFGTETRWSYDGSPKSSADADKYTVAARSSSYSANSMKKLIAKASPGDVLQMNAPKIHTMIFLGSDSNGFTVYDANWTGANQVSIRYVSYGAWSGRNSSGICVLHSTDYPAK